MQIPPKGCVHFHNYFIGVGLANVQNYLNLFLRVFRNIHDLDLSQLIALFNLCFVKKILNN